MARRFVLSRSETLHGVTSLLVAASALGLVGCFDEFGSYGSGGAGGGVVDQDVGGGSTTAAGGSSTTGLGGSTATGAGDETCDNGVDDDGDELADCLDPACLGAAFTCLAAPSEPGWLGPVHLMPRGSEAPCGPAFPDPGPTGMWLASGGAACGCACGAPSGGSCVATVQSFTNGSCAGTSTTTSVSSGTCVGTSGSIGSALAMGAPTGGSCVGSALPPEQPVFEERRSCAARAAAGCEPGTVCARPPATSEDSPLCFYRDGDEPCPGAPFDLRFVLYDGVPDDQRSCSPATCSCAAPTGGSCTGTVTLNQGGCGSTVADTIATGACEALTTPQAIGSMQASLTLTSPGSCAPVPRTQTGGFVGAATTLCCTTEI